MVVYQPATPHSDSVERPHCSRCGTGMYLFGIEPESSGKELLSFECHNIETRIGKAE
jgi:hypothetical protein